MNYSNTIDLTNLADILSFVKHYDTKRSLSSEDAMNLIGIGIIDHLISSGQSPEVIKRFIADTGTILFGDIAEEVEALNG